MGTIGARFCADCGARLAQGDTGLSEDLLTGVRGEHRFVTVLFADMTSSVARTRDLDAERAVGLVNPLLEAMVDVVVEYGGRIDRFLGDGVLAVFGAPISHEDDPVRAITAAVELRNRATSLDLDVTVGVNTGRVYFGPVGSSSLHEEMTVMGPTVNLAARLQGAAGAGEILVGESVQTHASSSFELEPRVVTIKGIDDPVTAYLVRDAAVDTVRARGIAGLRTELAGRDIELARLSSTVSNQRCAVVVGDAGIGKSRLVKEIRARFSEHRWLTGRCQDLTSSVPFAGIIDVFVDWIGERPTSRNDVAAALATVGVPPDEIEQIVAPLSRLIGLISTRSDVDPVVLQRLQIEAIIRWSKALPTSTVVFVDDLHWADPLTVRVIARLIAVEGFSVIITSRRFPRDPLDTLVELSTDLEQIELHELNPEAAAAVVQGLLASSGVPAERELELVERSGGNPFYLEELLRLLIEQGALTQTTTGWESQSTPFDLELPVTIEAVVMSRFDQLPDEARRVGRLAAVVDRPFEAEFLDALAGTDTARGIDALVSSGMLDRRGRMLRFHHDLAQDAIYSSLLSSQRERLHERTGDLIARLDPGNHDALAHHYDRSSNHLAAVTHLHAAAAAAYASHALETASALLERAFNRLDDLDEDSDLWCSKLLTLRAKVHERRSRYAEARADLEAAVEVNSVTGGEACEVHRLLGRVLGLESQFDLAHSALDVAESTVDAHADPGSWIDIQIERAQLLYFGGRGGELPELIDRVQPVLDSHGTTAQRIDALSFIALDRFISERFRLTEETVEICRAAVALAYDDPGRLADARFRLGFALLWADLIEEAAAVLDLAIAEAGRVGHVMLETRALVYHAVALRRLGRVTDASEVARRALSAVKSLEDDYYLGHVNTVLGWVAWKTGASESAMGHLQAATAIWGPLERNGRRGFNVEFGWLAIWPMAAIAIERSDIESALAALELLTCPWERPMGETVERAVRRALDRGDSDSVTSALHAARVDNLL